MVGRGDDFYQVPEARQRCTVSDEDGWFPVYFHENQVFGSVHTASFDALAAAIPSELIAPIRLPGGRGLITLMVTRHGVVTWTGMDGSPIRKSSFGEVAVSVPVSWKGRGEDPQPRARLGGFVLHQPVTAWQPCEDGWELLGFPKFVADMNFNEGTRTRRVQVAEDGEQILDLQVRPGGPAAGVDQSGLAYTSMNAQLIALPTRMIGHWQVRLGRDIGRLHLGGHLVGERLRALDVSPHAIAVVSFLSHRTSITRLGSPVGVATNYRRYPGHKRPLGRYTVTYPGIGTVDLNEQVHPPD